MSHDHESSYYEIALTNRQVLTVFVVLLTCLVAAFLSGVWIGQRDRAEAALLGAAGETPAENGAAALAELNFFAEAPPLRPSAEAAEPASPPPAAAADSGDAPPAPPARPQQSGSQQPPAPSGPVSTSSTATAGPVIQVFSTPDLGQARRVLQRLDGGGYPAYLLQEDLEGQTTYRVRVGPYREEAEARRIADELRRQYRLDTWITTQQPG